MKKGFTLIELLAVIVILAIIALIATPIVLNMIESARKSAAKDTAYGYVDSIEYSIGFADIGADGYQNINIPDGTYQVTDSALANIKIKGKLPESGSVTIQSRKVTDATLCISNYNVLYNGKEARIDGKCQDSDDNNSYLIYDPYIKGDRVYYNPITNSYCASKDIANNCYEWIVVNPNLTDTKISMMLIDDIDGYKVSSTTVSGTTTIIDDINTITADWSNALSVTDSDHKIFTSSQPIPDKTVTYDFSDSKARIPYNTEIDYDLIVSLKGDSRCGANNSEPCIFFYAIDGEETSSNWNAWGILSQNSTSIANAGPITATGPVTNSHIHPIVEVTKKSTSVPYTVKTIYKTNKINNVPQLGLVGAVYLNPKDLTENCTATLANSNVNNNNTFTGVKEGCMKWYIYGTNGNKYKLLLDHNTSGNVRWSSNDYNGNKDIINARLEQDTEDWFGTPRLIEASEIATVTGNTSFDNTINTYFTFNSSSSTSAYSWLYDNTYNCLSSGCSIQEQNTYEYTTNSSNPGDDAGHILGYWTGSKVTGTSGLERTYNAWTVLNNGTLNGSYHVYISYYFGVRPVIELPWSVFK